MAGSGIFTGVALARVDGKGRVSLPAGLRNEIPEAADSRIFIAQHETQPCLIGAGADLTVRLKDYLRDLEAAALARGEPFDRQAASIRLFGGTAVPIDPSGRFTMPDVQAATVDLGEELILLGRGDIFEIWDLAQLMAGEGEGFAAAQAYACAAIKVRDRDDARKAAKR